MYDLIMDAAGHVSVFGVLGIGITACVMIPAIGIPVGLSSVFAGTVLYVRNLLNETAEAFEWEKK